MAETKNWYEDYPEAGSAPTPRGIVVQPGSATKGRKAAAETTSAEVEAAKDVRTLNAIIQKAQAEGDKAVVELAKAKVDLLKSQKDLEAGPPKTATEIELAAKKEGAKQRAAVVRSQMLNSIQLYKQDIQGRPASRAFGALERMDKPSFGGVVPAIPAYERFTATNAAILPLIRPLVAQSAKEGDSDKEMQVFQSYIPEAGDSDATIEQKYAMLDTLIAGMAEGRPPSEVIGMGVKPRGIGEIESSIREELDPNKVRGYRLPQATEGKIRALYEQGKLTPQAYADLVTTGAIEAGIQPDDAFKADALAKGEGTVKAMQAGAPFGGISYEDVDKSARQSMTIPETGLSFALNLPVNAVQTFAETGKALTTDLPKTVQTIGNLAGDALGITDGETLKALGEHYANQYGTAEGFQTALAEKPFEVLLDATTVAGALGAAGKVAKATELSNMLDPVKLSARVAKLPVDIATGGVKLAGEATAQGLGLSTGAGGEAIKEAVKAGRAGGERGATFLDYMRGGGDPEDIVGMAREALKNMREEASQRYRTGFADVQKDKALVDFDPIFKRLAKIKDRAYIGDKVRNPSAAAVYDKAKDIITDWYNSDPDKYHTPEGMDGLKQRLGELDNTFSIENNRRAASIAKSLYGEVRQAIAEQVPTYSKVMKDYEDAAKTLGEIETTLSLKPGAPIDRSMRTLQSLIGRNVSSRRAQLGSKLEEAGASELMPALAGEQLSAKLPRGLSQAGAGLGGVTLGALGLKYLPALAATSPRLVGEAAYKIGQGVGAVERGAAPVIAGLTERAQPFTDALPGLLEKYAQNRLPVQGGMAALQGIEGAQKPSPLENIPPVSQETVMPSEPAGIAPPTDKPGAVMFEGRAVEYDPATDTYVELKTGRRVRNLEDLTKPEGMYRGGLMALARMYG